MLAKVMLRVFARDNKKDVNGWNMILCMEERGENSTPPVRLEDGQCLLPE